MHWDKKWVLLWLSECTAFYHPPRGFAAENKMALDVILLEVWAMKSTPFSHLCDSVIGFRHSASVHNQIKTDLQMRGLVHHLPFCWSPLTVSVMLGYLLFLLLPQVHGLPAVTLLFFCPLLFPGIVPSLLLLHWFFSVHFNVTSSYSTIL